MFPSRSAALRRDVAVVAAEAAARRASYKIEVAHAEAVRIEEERGGRGDERAHNNIKRAMNFAANNDSSYGGGAAYSAAQSIAYSQTTQHDHGGA